MSFQKFTQSIAKRGITGTIRRTWHYVLDFIRWYLDARFDKRYRVDTSGKLILSDLEIDSKNLPDATWYEPIPTLRFKHLMHKLSINFDDFIFIDIGSGKGRALFLASEYTFKKIIGIEFSRDIHDVALRNINNYKNPKRRCYQIESVCMDALDFVFPPVPSVIFFYSPFQASVFTKVINNIKKSIKEFPRSIYLLYIGYMPDVIEVLKNSDLSFREVDLGHDYIRWEKKRGLILHNEVA